VGEREALYGTLRTQYEEGTSLQKLLSSGLKPDFDGKFRLNPVPNETSLLGFTRMVEKTREIATLWLELLSLSTAQI
jgi:hypothetical protein